jgi:hypothetical protein
MFLSIQLILRSSVSSDLSYTFRDYCHIGCDYYITAVHEAATVHATVSGELAFQTPDFDASFTCPYQFILYVTSVETKWVVMASRKGDR